MFTKKEFYSLESLSCENSLDMNEDNRRQSKDISTDGRITQNTPLTLWRSFLGLIYVIFHVVSLQLLSVIVKKTSYISIAQFSLIRYIASFAAALPLLIYHKKQFLGEKRHRFLLIVRGLLAANGWFLQILACRYLQLIEISIVMSTFPFCTAIIARIFLKEQFRLVQTITLVITICGVLVSLRLPQLLTDKSLSNFDVSYVIGLMTSVGSVLCLSTAVVVTRKMKEAHYSVIMLYVGFLGMIENAILCETLFPLVLMECGWDQVSCMLIGIFAVGTSAFLTLAIQEEPSGIVAVQKCSVDILVTAVFQILFFSQYPDVYVISGSCLVLTSLAVMGVKNCVLTMPETSITRQKLKWILL